MTIKPSGSPLALSEIDAEFGLGTNLAAYRGVRWYLDNAATGLFPDAVSFNDFYSKRAASPVTPGSTTISSSGDFTVPLYSVLTVTIRGGSGGGAGGSGNASQGNNGGPGTASSFGSYGSGDFGRGAIGGSKGANGLNSDGDPAGGAGGGGNGGAGSGGPGGDGGKTVITLTNPIAGGTGPAVGSTVFVTIGNGGSGGSAGGSFVNGYYFAAGSGSPGRSGRVEISWS